MKAFMDVDIWVFKKLVPIYLQLLEIERWVRLKIMKRTCLRINTNTNENSKHGVPSDLKP